MIPDRNNLERKLIPACTLCETLVGYLTRAMQCFVFEINVSRSKQELGGLSKNMSKSDVIGDRPALWHGSQFLFCFQTGITNA